MVGKQFVCGWNRNWCRSITWALVVLPLIAAGGCSSFGNGKLVKELQRDNDRLLTEFRAERGRREEAEKRARLLENRLAESEKLLARQSQSYSPSRISSLQPGRAELSQGLLPSQSTSVPSLGGPAARPKAPASGEPGFKWQRRATKQ